MSLSDYVIRVPLCLIEGASASQSRAILELEDYKRYPTFVSHDVVHQRPSNHRTVRNSRCQGCHPITIRKTGQTCPKFEQGVWVLSFSLIKFSTIFIRLIDNGCFRLQKFFLYISCLYVMIDKLIWSFCPYWSLNCYYIFLWHLYTGCFKSFIHYWKENFVEKKCRRKIIFDIVFTCVIF